MDEHRWRVFCCSSTATTTWNACSGSTTKVRRPGPTPRPCSPSGGTATPPKPVGCSGRPRRPTSTSRPACWARRSRRPSRPATYSPGDESEALHYVGGFLAAWKSTPGAVAWLRENAQAKQPKEGPSAKGPLGVIKKWLTRNLPQKDDVWQADFRQMPNWIRVGGKPRARGSCWSRAAATNWPWPTRWRRRRPRRRCCGTRWCGRCSTRRRERPHRPAELQVRPDERWESLKPHLDEIGVGLAAGDDLGQLRDVFKDMTEHVGGKPEAGAARHAGRDAGAGRRVLRGGSVVLPAGPVEEGRLRVGDQGRVRQLRERPLVRRA